MVAFFNYPYTSSVALRAWHGHVVEMFFMTCRQSLINKLGVNHGIRYCIQS